MKLGIGIKILFSGFRAFIQLFLVGLVLDVIFELSQLGWILAISGLMLCIAGFEVASRQSKKFKGWIGFGIGSFSMFLSSFVITFFALTIVIQNKPWYLPQYAIPLLGMLLGNTMNGISISLDRLTQTVFEKKEKIEQKLVLGFSKMKAVQDIRNDSIRSGLIPVFNSMATAGIVSLPGMMTGQILAGIPPVEAVKYQIVIYFLIGTGTGLGVIASTWLATWILFDERHRLKLYNLK